MVKIIYNGDIGTCRIKIRDTIINRWARGEIKELSEGDANKLLNDNKNFSLVGKKVEEPKKEVKEKIDIDNMSKDALIDLSVK